MIKQIQEKILGSESFTSWLVSLALVLAVLALEIELALVLEIELALALETELALALKIELVLVLEIALVLES